DELRRTVWQQIRQRDLRQFQRFLSPARLRQAAVEAGVGLGAGVLNLPALVWLGISAAFHGGEDFAGVLRFTLQPLQGPGASTAICCIGVAIGCWRWMGRASTCRAAVRWRSTSEPPPTSMADARCRRGW